MVIFVARDLIDRIINKIKIKKYIKALIFHVISSGHLNSTVLNLNRISGVMVSVLTSSAVEPGFKP